LALKTPNLVNFARSFFDCQGITYVPLENDGDEGSAYSHLERAVFFNEIMTASTVKDQIFSGFSLNLLKDSGWYGVNDQLVDSLSAGRNMGCDWYKACKDIKNHSYFCPFPGESSCNFDYTAVGFCNNEFLEKDECFITYPYNNMNCAVYPKNKESEMEISAFV